MDELEFRKRVYAAPSELDQELLDAAQGDSRLQAILDEARQLDADIHDIVTSVVVPEGLKNKLMEIPDSDASEPDAEPNMVTMPDRPAANSSFFHYYAIAASLLLVIGVTFTLSYDSGPSLAELAIGDGVVSHLYGEAYEMEMLDATGPRNALAWNEVDTVMAHVDTELANAVGQQNTVFYANPCIIFPEYSSSHLMLEGSEGVVNVFIILNSPVSKEYQIRDDRFDGLVMPLDQGNMILLAEDGEDLEMYKEMLSENMEWVI